MIIDPKKIKEERLPNFKGGDGDFIARIREDDLGKIIFGRLEPGCSIGYHSHDIDSEIIYILSGKAFFRYDHETEIVGAGECHCCPKGHSHAMINKGTEDIVFFAAVPKHEIL